MAQMNRNRANQLLSDLIRNIAVEKTEELKDEHGQPLEIVSKAEALARIIWQMSLGWVESEDILQNGIKVGTRIKRYPPAQWAIKEVLDRAEGKAAQTGTPSDSQADVADRITDRTKNRVNALADVEDLSKQDASIPPIRTMPRHPSREIKEQHEE